MELRHPFCKDNTCLICLEDFNALEKRLDKKLGRPPRAIDFIGKYRWWHIHVRKIPETEWEWFHPDVFKEKNINAFCEWYSSQKPYGIIELIK